MRILVYDHGLCLELACLLGRAGHTVFYHCSPSDKLSRFAVAQIGKGFEHENVHKVNNFWEQVDSVHMICLFDTYNGDLTDYLLRKGYTVWGAGAVAEMLELDRQHAMRVESMNGLRTPNTKIVIGVANLIKELQKPDNRDLWVKCSGFREIETFHHESWATTQEQFVAPLLCEYGTDPDLTFLLTKPIDPAIEVGADSIILGGRPTLYSMYGYEDKDTSYIGRVVYGTAIPFPLQKVNDATLSNRFSNHINDVTLANGFRDHSTFYSTETRVTPNGESYPIDLTVRAAHPPIAGMMEAYSNMAGVIARMEEPTVIGTQYCAVIVGSSGWADEHRMEVSFPSNIRQWVKLAGAYRQNNKYYTLPLSCFHVQCVGVGTTIKQACKGAQLIAEQVKGKDLSFDFSSFDKLQTETIPTGVKNGIPF